MKRLNIISFGPEDFKRAVSGKPTIRINLTRCGLTVAAVEKIGCKKGQSVRLHQDQNDPSVWYLTIERSGFELKQNSKNASLSFYCREMAQILLDCFHMPNGLSLLVGEEPIVHKNVSYWPLTLSGQHEEEEESTIDEADERTNEAPKGKRGPKPGSKRKRKASAEQSNGVPTLADLENPY